MFTRFLEDGRCCCSHMFTDVYSAVQPDKTASVEQSLLINSQLTTGILTRAEEEEKSFQTACLLCLEEKHKYLICLVTEWNV